MDLPSLSFMICLYFHIFGFLIFFYIKKPRFLSGKGQPLLYHTTLRNTQVGWEVTFSALNFNWLIFSSAVSSLLLLHPLNLKSMIFFISRSCTSISTLHISYSAFFLFLINNSSLMHLIYSPYLKKFNYPQLFKIYCLSSLS